MMTVNEFKFSFVLERRTINCVFILGRLQEE